MKTSTLAAVIFLSVVSFTASIRLPPQWCAKIAQLCDDFKDDHPALPFIDRVCYLITLEQSLNEPILYLFPPVIMWSPVEQFQDTLHVQIFCPKCIQLGKMDIPLHASGWRNALDGVRSEPRKIYGSEGICLIIGRVYRCHNSHEDHPGLLEQISTNFIPFRLWHKTGFTTEFVDLIVALITTGLSISEIRNFVYKRHVSHYHGRNSQFNKALISLKRNSSFPSLDAWEGCFPNVLPSIHALSGCFLADFWNKDCIYTRCMQNMTIDEWLSLDHTFSSTKNIGFSRTGDNRWITQYEALFCVLNAQGQVLTWRLTPRLSFAEVESDLTALKGRLQSQGKVLKEFYIDNCCSWRQKLQQVFGNELIVYLDIFHAVKRFSEKVPKRHALRRDCLLDWKMVFRDPSDQGQKRALPTPSPGVMDSNINNFLQHWQNAEYNGKKLLSAAALKEIENIRVHVKKGCLSGIKPGRGTNRNENLHKDLNKIMSNSKYGVELAYALLTVNFFNHNERMAAKHEQRMEHPIQCYTNLSMLSPERFGLKFAQDHMACSSTEKDGFSKLKITSSSYTQIYNRVMHTPLPEVGHVKQRDNFIDNEDDMTPAANIDLTLTGVNECDEFIHVYTLKKILMQSISWYFTHKFIQDMSETAQIRIDQIPFMISATSDLSSSIMGITQEEEDTGEKIIDNLLKSWNLKRQEMPRDGNCLFYSVAYNLKTQVERGNTDLNSILDVLQIDAIHSTLSQIASTLRECVVKEWLGENSTFYHGFITKDQLQTEALEFLKDGAFTMDVGDLAVTALCNLLHTPLVIFTSRPNQPILVQNPTYSTMASPHPIYLAFLHFGPGHYDAVASEMTQEDSVTVISAGSCNCGKKTSKGNACSFSLNKYTCRCPCYNAKRSCSQDCKCKGCTNSFGVRPAVKKVGLKRKRLPHEAQLTQLKGKKTARFMEDIGEPTIAGGLSTMEFLVICSIIATLMTEDFDWADSQLLNPTKVYTIYCIIRDLVQTVQLDIALYDRTEKDIEKLLRNASFKWNVFNQKNMMST